MIKILFIILLILPSIAFAKDEISIPFTEENGRLNMKEFADTDLIMWWNIDLSGEKPVGEIEIEISGKGPQIKLTTIN